MNRARRDRQKANRCQGGGHTAADHEPGAVREGRKTPGPVKCPVCRPAARQAVVHGDGERWRP
jgi:hypothetical protein